MAKLRRGAAILVWPVLTGVQLLAAQARVPPLPRWRPQPLGSSVPPVLALRPRAPSLSTLAASEHRHTITGLLIGGLVGTVAAGAFLGAFCNDPDTHCGAGEVGRAIVIIAVPPTLLGAVIGSLIRTKP